MPAALLDTERLLDLAGELRASGFRISTAQHIAAQELLLALAARRGVPEGTQEFRTLLAPIYCTTPEEQSEFYRQFSNWAARLEAAEEPKLREQPAAGATKRSRVRRYIALGVLAVFLGAFPEFVTWVNQRSSTSTPPITKPVFTPERAPVAEPFNLRQQLEAVRWPLAGFAALVLIALLLWQRQRRLELARWRTRQSPRLEQLRVKMPPRRLFNSPHFRRAFQDLRRHRARPSGDLDPEATIQATIRSGGWFDARYSTRKETPEYLILIDRESFQDQQAALFDELTAWLASIGVGMERYFFQRDPRTCRVADTTAPHLPLSALGSRQKQQHLIVFSDGSEFINPLSAGAEPWIDQFFSWPSRALLTPRAVDEWDSREMALSAAGFIVLPATPLGLTLLSDALHEGQHPRWLPGTGAVFPPLLTGGQPERWREDRAPAGELVERLSAQLRAYLGADGYRLLCACSVYPLLAWPLTLYFASTLLPEPDLETTLRALVRLPWFRDGAMPDWLRRHLIESLEPEWEARIRESLERLFLTTLQRPGERFSLDVALPGPETSGDVRHFLRKLLAREPENSPLRDYVLVSFLKRGRLRRLAVAVPDALRRLLLRQSGPAELGTRRSLKPLDAFLMYVGLAVALYVVGGTAGFMAIEHWTVFNAFYVTLWLLTKTAFGEILSLSPAGQLWHTVLMCGSSVLLLALLMLEFLILAERHRRVQLRDELLTPGVPLVRRWVARRVAYLVLAAGALLSIGTIAFVLVEHLTPLDGFYMTFSILIRDLIGEFHPLGRAFNSVLIVASYGVLISGLAILILVLQERWELDTLLTGVSPRRQLSVAGWATLGFVAVGVASQVWMGSSLSHAFSWTLATLSGTSTVAGYLQFSEGVDTVLSVFAFGLQLYAFGIVVGWSVLISNRLASSDPHSERREMTFLPLKVHIACLCLGAIILEIAKLYRSPVSRLFPLALDVLSLGVRGYGIGVATMVVWNLRGRQLDTYSRLKEYSPFDLADFLSIAKGHGRVLYISYRPGDSDGYARLLRDRLGEERTHMDRPVWFKTDSLAPLDYDTAFDAMIVLIGNRWLGASGRDGVRLLDDPNDFVRREIAYVLKREIPIIPVLVEGARMPSTSDLPPELARLTHYVAYQIRDDNFLQDVERLSNDLLLVVPKQRRASEMDAD